MVRKATVKIKKRNIRGTPAGVHFHLGCMLVGQVVSMKPACIKVNVQGCKIMVEETAIKHSF